MGILNGTYEFYYSKKQREELMKKAINDKGYYRPKKVIIRPEDPNEQGETKEYTECIHVANKDDIDWKKHNKRYDDSETLGQVRCPILETGSPIWECD